MRDGSTRQLETTDRNEVFSRFLSRYQTAVVVLSGAAKGTEYPLDAERVTLGRGPGVDLAFDDSTMSSQHAAIEFSSGGFRLRDLDSTNGMLVNGSSSQLAELKHGDKFQLGECQFQFVVEERRHAGSAYELPED